MSDPVEKRIAREIGEHGVVLFMKGMPVFPQCGFLSLMVQVLSRLGVRAPARSPVAASAARV